MKPKGITLLAKAWLVLGMVSAVSALGTEAPSPAQLTAVSATNQASGSELWLGVQGAFTFKTIQATDDTLFIDLLGVKAGAVAKTQQWTEGVITGYHLLEYLDTSHHSVVRVQVEMKHTVAIKVAEERAGLRVLFGQMTQAMTAPAVAAPAHAPIPAPVVAKPTGSPSAHGLTTVVSGISIKTGSEGQAIVDVMTSRAAAYRVMHLENPSRLAVDLENANYSGRRRAFGAQSPLLKGVRIGQFRTSNPAVVRVVADLAGNPAFDVHAQAMGVRIELRSRAAAHPVVKSSAEETPSLPAPRPAEASPATVIATAEPPVTAPASPEGAQPQRPAPAPASNPARARVEAPATLPADYHATLPPSAGSTEVTAAPAPPLEPPAETPESLRAAKAAQILRNMTEQASAAPQGQAAGAAAGEKPQYTGETISLNLKEFDLKDFFRLIHEISGLNILVDPNVAGNVTLVLDTVPWDQALDIVLKNNHLDKVLEGNVLRIARLETLAAEQDSVKKLAEAREEAQPLVTVFRPVNYAKAQTIATMLTHWSGGALSKRGTVLVDDRGNTLIISDIQSRIPVIESIIVKLDKKAKQISIEARIVLATADFSRTLGTALAGAYAKTGGGGLTKTNAGAASGGSITGTAASPPAITTPSATGFAVFAISNASTRYAIDAAIAAEEIKKNAKTLSRPSIVTQNNVPGKIQQGTQVPVTTSINNTVTTSYIPAALTMTVTPQVTDDGNIFLIIDVNAASVNTTFAFASGNPGIDNQMATTQVLVPDGGTVVFGGVTKTARNRSANYVPLLGNIPIFGHLFKVSSVSDSDTELLFFVSPKILPG